MARILVVDDEELIRVLLQKALEDINHDIELASDGNQAIEIFHQNPPDLMITDLSMPGKPGIETIIEITHSFPEAKIIAMSGSGPQESDLSMIKNGTIKVYQKPLDLNRFIVAVQEFLVN